MSIPPPSHPRKKVRTVCVAIPYDQATDRILMVTSRKHPTKWILPKGGWEEGESLGEAARREAREEAGVVSLPFEIPPTAIHVNQDHKTIYHYFHLPVISLSIHFLEDTQRKRQWVTYAEAEERIRAWAKDDNEPDGCKRKKEMGEGLLAWKAWKDKLKNQPETVQPPPSQSHGADLSTLG
ncbi:Diadenosine and diphosphoinositol polyphosphate phosphohydrolase [Phaffia rhodozyma]|uniref:Diadenosine and diphosphoinositol polyphosphate phosphohydrolase n=1 Tax=Phaffia rhodozyma TaxID=264483 RepID=A0A0F7SRZ0_PHARH|nr:Diadenosine and diphosphoinositol polyphosphate phosphohydrolase [Phaffia rhodozyma]